MFKERKKYTYILERIILSKKKCVSRLINTRKLIGREKKEKRYEGKRIISREERGVTRSFISFASSINSPQEANALNARYEEGGERR